jgi:DNA mismatch repair protein MutL
MNQPPVQPTIRVNPNYNPFRTTDGTSSARSMTMPQERMNPTRAEVAAWLENHKPSRTATVFSENEKPTSPLLLWLSIFEEMDDFRFSQIGNDTAIAVHTRGLVLFSINGARERILYERNLNALVNQAVASQQQLFPQQIRLSPNDYLLAREIDSDLRKLGFDLADFGGQTIVAQGIPTGLEPGEVPSALQHLLEQYRENRDRLQLPAHECLARSTARALVSRNRPVHVSRELRQLAIDLLHCEDPTMGLNGKRIFRTAAHDQLNQFIQNGNFTSDND